MNPDTPQPDAPREEGAPIPEEANEPAGEPAGFPFTPGGVASFAVTGWGRLLKWQFITALALGSALLLLAAQHWAPVIDRFVHQHFPEQTGLNAGRLIWPADGQLVTVGNSYFVLRVDPQHDSETGLTGDVQVELTREDWTLRWVFGEQAFEYAPGTVELDRATAVPWWGSRRPFILLAVGASGGLLLLLGALLFGGLAAWPMKAVASYLNRESALGPVWRTATAATLPGIVLLTMGLLCYAIGLPLMGLLAVLPLCLLLSGGYAFLAVFQLPKSEDTAADPFGEGAGEEEETDETAGRGDNPFAADEPEDG